VERHRRQVAGGGKSNRFETVVAEGLIPADGTAEWGYTHGLPNGDPLPISPEANSSGSELDRYVQGRRQMALPGETGPLG
jgi:hypothetical protein